MKLHYDTKADSLYIDLIDRASVESIEVAPGVDHASRVADLTSLDSGILPLTADLIQE